MKNVTKSGCELPLTDKGQFGKKVYKKKKLCPCSRKSTDYSFVEKWMKAFQPHWH